MERPGPEPPASAGRQNTRGRKEYQPPRLICYGDLAALTRLRENDPPPNDPWGQEYVFTA